MKKAWLALEDGTCLEGVAFGAEATVTGEACFNTSMSGYQEVLTDPSYRGQIIAMTCPMIGNYGVNEEDMESSAVHARGFVVEELTRVPSNWRSTATLDEWLRKEGVPGIEGIDTRYITKKLRVNGAMRAALTTEDMSPEEVVRLARSSQGMLGMDYVREVTAKHSFAWDESNVASREWTLPSPQDPEGRQCDETGCYFPLDRPKYKIVAYDFGMKRNILRRLRQAGLEVEVVPATESAADVLARNPDGVFLSNGPGDPASLDYAHKEVASLIGKVPLYAICLGHQIVSHAIGGKTFKMKFGHRGGNQPVKDLRTGKVVMTSQNHGFAVDPDSLPDGWAVTHVNLNDNTVEGIRHNSEPVISVQYHPEAAPGPNDARYFFDEFTNLIEEFRKP